MFYVGTGPVPLRKYNDMTLVQYEEFYGNAIEDFDSQKGRVILYCFWGNRNCFKFTILPVLLINLYCLTKHTQTI
jgi:hypothetical protein